VNWFSERISTETGVIKDFLLDSHSHSNAHTDSGKLSFFKVINPASDNDGDDDPTILEQNTYLNRNYKQEKSSKNQISEFFLIADCDSHNHTLFFISFWSKLLKS
jgi:hypothetical protein